MKLVIRGQRGFAVLGHDRSGRIRTRHLNGIDVLAGGAQKLIPPTPHPAGTGYVYLAGTLEGLCPEQLGPIPPDVGERLREALVPVIVGSPCPVGFRASDVTCASDLSTQERDRHRRYAAAILAGELSVLASMPRNSGRNAAAFRLACRVGRWVHAGILPADRLTASVLEACRANGLVAEDGARAVLVTVASGLRASAADHLPTLGRGGRRYG